MVVHALLPDALVKPCVGVLEVMSANERDLVRVVVEVVSEIRDACAQSGAVQPEDEMVMSLSFFVFLHGSFPANRSKVCFHLHRPTRISPPQHPLPNKSRRSSGRLKREIAALSDKLLRWRCPSKSA
jgi:hypothetical protein